MPKPPLLTHPASYSTTAGRSFPTRKAAGSVKLSNHPIYYQVQEHVELYLHSLPAGINLSLICDAHVTTLS